MRLAHLADLHLGFRQYERSAPGGMNAREADVQDALARTVADVIEQRPDLVLLAGDVFHQVRPPNAAIVFLFHQLERIRGALPATRIIIVAGNHDTARTAETGAILPLYRRLGVDVVTAGVERIVLPGCTVTCVPSSAVRQPFAPDPEAALNVLLIHADAPAVSHGEADVTDEQLQTWDYGALGDYHTLQQVGPRAWYPGALEYTSNDVWSETRAHPEKGWLCVELEPGTEPRVSFRPIATRRFLDLPPVDAQGLGAEQLDAAIAAALGAVELDGAVVRLVVLNVPRDLQRAIDYAALRVFKGQAFHLQVDFRRPAAEARTWAANARTARTLNQIVEEFMRARPLPSDLEPHREEFVKLTMEYMEVASEADDPYTGEQVA